ncbi:MAG: glycosyltransferase family 4 protein [Bacteroidales bacterium]|nr:glycosyltransferase family 4 protein [Bacteroidales bacterium]
MELKDLKNKKIVIFSPEIPPSVAGSGVNAYYFAKFLSVYSSNTMLCHLNYNNQFPAWQKESKLIISRLLYYNKNITTKLLSFLPLLFSYFKKIKNNDIIIIYSGYLIGFQFVILLSLLFRKKVIFRSTLLNGDDAMTLVSGVFLLRKINKKLLGKITLYFSINKEFTKRYKKIFDNKVPVFESFQGVNINVFHPVSVNQKKIIRKKIGLPDNHVVLITIGNLIMRKGYHLLFPQIAKLTFPFIYLIVGDYEPTPFHKVSNKEKIFMKYLYNLGNAELGKKVFFTGPVSNISEYLCASDFYIHGAYNEGTPNVLLEAMACGIPSLLYKLTGLSGTLIHDNMNAIEYIDYDQIPSMLEKLYKDKNKMRKISLNSSFEIAEKYSFEKVATQLFKQLYA